MGFVREQKNSKYFSNFTPKRRRRREGKTDYKARRSMIIQDLSMYGTPKYRFVVRRSNKRIICQIMYSTLTGDRCIASADSFELRDHGLKVGLTNYAAAYCTGLLCARRMLTSIGLADQFVGKEEADGEEYHVEEGEQRPFKCILDIGLYRSTKGARVFGAMKGAVDGGLDIPHSISCFPGNEGEGGEAHLERILGSHVADYMKEMQEDDEEKFKLHFSKYISNNVTADSLEDMYRAVHKSVRATPVRKVVDKEARKAACKAAHKSNRQPKLNAAQRRERVQKKLAIIAEQMAA